MTTKITSPTGPKRGIHYERGIDSEKLFSARLRMFVPRVHHTELRNIGLPEAIKPVTGILSSVSRLRL